MAYSSRKEELLAQANRKLEMLRWFVRLAKGRKVLTEKHYRFACSCLTESGRILGGWLKQAAVKHRRNRPRGGTSGFFRK